MVSIPLEGGGSLPDGKAVSGNLSCVSPGARLGPSVAVSDTSNV